MLVAVDKKQYVVEHKRWTLWKFGECFFIYLFIYFSLAEDSLLSKGVQS